MIHVRISHSEPTQVSTTQIPIKMDRAAVVPDLSRLLVVRALFSSQGGHGRDRSVVQPESRQMPYPIGQASAHRAPWAR